MDSSFYGFFDSTSLSSFCADYENNDRVKQEDRDGNYFNKVGPNKHVRGMNGTYYIPYRCRFGLARQMFYKICAYYLFNGLRKNLLSGKDEYYINFAQYLPKVAPLCLDFDLVFKFTHDVYKKFGEHRDLHLYNFNHISKIVEILNNIIYDNFEIEKEEIKAYVQEKDEFKFKAKEQVKDGLHIIYLLPFSVAERFFIRDELIKKLKEIDFIKSFNFEITNSYEEIVDEAVIERNPWLTYGSIKVTSKKLKDANGNIIYYTNKEGKKKAKVQFEHSLPYKLTHIFDFDLYDENYDGLGNMLTYDTEEELEGLMNLFDLDQFSDEDPLDAKTEKAEEFIENWERKDKEKKERIKSYESRSISIDTYNTNSFTMNNNKTNEKNYDIKKLTPKILQNIIKDLVIYDINYIFHDWFLICGAIRNCTLICFNGDEKKAKDYVHYFCKQDKGFCKDNFEDDYEKIKKASNDYQGKQCNIRTLIEHIYDPKKVDEFNKCLEKDKKVEDYKLTNIFSFNNYKKNNYSNMDSSDSSITKENSNSNNNQLSIIDYYNEIENEYYEHYKNDDIEIKPEKIPELIINQGKLFEPFRYDLLHNERYVKKGVTKSGIRDVLCYYLFRLVLYIQGEDYYYVYDFENKVYICKNKTLAFQYIYDKDLDFEYYNKDGKKKSVTINPKKLYLSYIDINHWERRRDINQPKLYKEIKLVNGEELERKNIFNDGPSIPSYLTENYKSFDEYGQKYKDFVNGFFLLLKYSLCDGKEEDYEYLKNWVINKALFKRNRTVLVLQSPGQGIGKSTVAQMIKAMCEDKYVSIGNKCDWLNEKFNSILKDKILVGIEEMTVSDSKAIWITMVNRMKDLSTNSTMVLEFKGKDPFDADIEFDFVITSNYYNNFATDVENRRFFIPNVTANKYKEIPTFKPEILKTRPITIKENGIIKKINEIKNIDQLCKYLNGIIINKGNSDTQLSKYEKRKYFRCFYAYCNENQNEEFEPSFIPMTDAIKHNADKTMKFIYKYIKIKELYGKSHLIIKKDKEGKIISSDIKFITTDIKYDIKDFAYSLYKNECTLKRYNYINSCVYEFFKEIGLTEKKNEASEITSQKINEFFKRYVNDFVKYKYVSSRKNNCYVFECSYNELLEFYKSSGFVIDSEYEKLKDNYDILKYCDYSEYFNSSSSDNYYEQVNELKQKLNEKDNLLKKQDEELESFKNTNEQQDKEIESLKNANEQKDNEIERLKAELEELKKLSLKTKEIEKSKTEDKEIKKSDIDDKKIEELKKECRDLLKEGKNKDFVRKMVTRCRKEGGLKMEGGLKDYNTEQLRQILREYSGYVEEKKN